MTLYRVQNLKLVRHEPIEWADPKVEQIPLESDGAERMAFSLNFSEQNPESEAVEDMQEPNITAAEYLELLSRDEERSKSTAEKINATNAEYRRKTNQRMQVHLRKLDLQAGDEVLLFREFDANLTTKREKLQPFAHVDPFKVSKILGNNQIEIEDKHGTKFAVSKALLSKLR
jgi:hypothetical protein